MSNTRREFLKSAALATAAIGDCAVQPAEGQPASPSLPTIRFGKVEISRLVLGTNPFYGFSHYSPNLDHAMRQWFTPDKVCETIRRAATCGINAFNYVNLSRAPQDMQKFYDEGGKIHLVAQILGDPGPTYKRFKPLAMYRQGEEVDNAFRNGGMETVHDWCRKTRDLGCLVGVGTHRPEVIEFIEEKGWDIDFYAGCVYKRSRTSQEWKELLHGELQEMPQETYLVSDPPRMYKIMRQTTKQCFAFKILAAARIKGDGVEKAFRTAFESIKPNDGIFVGMWPYAKDEIRENVEIVSRILAPRATTS